MFGYSNVYFLSSYLLSFTYIPTYPHYFPFLFFPLCPFHFPTSPLLSSFPLQTPLTTYTDPLPLDSPRIPLILLPYALETFLTTLVCMHEYAYWPIPRYQKVDLTKLYGPYILLCKYSSVLLYKFSIDENLTPPPPFNKE